jgi:2-aminoadipate transaminase
LITAANYYSDLASSGPPLFFPDPKVPVTFNFDQGVPAEETFPLEELRRLHEDVLRRDKGRALEYISMGFDEEHQRILYLSTYVELVLGNTTLRAELAKWLNGRNARTDLEVDNLIITSGSVQAIALAVNALVNEGDGVLIEAATFPYALRYIEMRRAHIRPVVIDADGLDPESLAEQLARMVADGIRPKLLYIVATFQLPTCACTSLERRRRILDLAEKYDFLVLEDNIYGDLRYSGEPIPTLLSMDTSGRVLQSNGFSKTVAPALRTGWITASKDLIAGLAAVRQDLGPSQWTCRVMADFVSSGAYDKQIDRVNDVYRRKRDIAVTAIREHCEPWVNFSVPDGGFFLWLELSDRVDWESVRQRSESAGVAFRPGERFMTERSDESGRGFLRLAYSHVDDDELRRGIAALGTAIKASIIPEA